MAISKQKTKQKPYKLSKNSPSPKGYKGVRLGQVYVIFGLVVLFATTLFWSILGAHLQADNADQLVDPYLFSNAHTFHQASFPATHTFLLKWPIFALISMFGISATHILIATVAAVLITVAGLVYLLFKIEGRPLVRGTICLALASMMLLIPAQPYPGGLLPVNMAMLATRNIEYLFYLAALGLIAKSPRMRSWHFWLAVVILAVLLASDRLFLGLSAGGALLGLIVYSLVRNWAAVSMAVRWLMASFAALLGAMVIIAALSGLGVTHFNSSSENSPYGVTKSAKKGVEGAMFAVAGFGTNFGANPAHQATEFKTIPHQFKDNLLSVGGPSYLINIALLVGGLWLSLRFIIGNMIRSYKNKSAYLDAPAKLSSMLIFSTAAALGVFVFTEHQYSVDARYLGIGFFALCVATVTVIRSKNVRPIYLRAAVIILCIGILLGVAHVGHQQHANKAALQDIHNRDELISQAMRGRHTQVLIGDYWRVMPTKLASNNDLAVWPLSACSEPRTLLTSEAWRPDITKQGFAYLLSLDKGLTDYPQCSLDEVLATYGKPNASLPIEGSVSQPRELLLFYDHGVHKSSPLSPQPQASQASVLPIPADELSNTTCEGPTVMNIVAHQDDDLLFMSPDLLHDVQNPTNCVRTVYLTAGDSGRDKFYWLSRQQGSEAAYSEMTHSKSVWVQRTVKLDENQYVTVANLRGNSTISLVFFNLADGNLKGEGFEASRDESLAKLWGGKISSMHTIDGESTYSSEDLTKALAKIMHIYQPAEIRTQASMEGGPYPDHSDHMTVGHFAQKAHDVYEQQQFNGLVKIPLTRYMGYPIHGLSPNVYGSDLDQKEAAFFAYSAYDGATCHSHADCQHGQVYGAYLSRQYRAPGN